MRFLAVLLLCACAHARPAPEALTERAHRLMLDGEWDEALAELAPAIADAGRRGDRVAEAALRAEEGRVLFDAHAQRDGRPELALPTLERARALVEGTGARELRARVLDRVGMVIYWQHFVAPPAERPAVLERARGLFAEAAAQRDRDRDVAESEFHLGLVEQMAGRLPPARERFARSLALAEKAGDKQMQSYAVRHLAYLDELDGELARAERGFLRSFELRREIGWRAGMVAAGWQVGLFAFDHRGDVAAARQRATDALAISDRIGGKVWGTRIRSDLARYDDLEGDLDGAARRLEALRGDAAAVHDPDLVAEVEERLGLIAVERGDLAGGAACFARAAAAGGADAEKQRARVEAVRRGAAGEDDPALLARFAIHAHDAAALARARALAEAAKDRALIIKIDRARSHG